MKILSFDTSSNWAVAALSEGPELIASSGILAHTRHSEILHEQFASLLKFAKWTFAEIDAIAVGIGPGSFTGLRVGVATAQGLAFAKGCSLFGVPSLDPLAQGAPHGPQRVVVCRDARKQEVYAGIYERSPTGDGLVTPSAPTRLFGPERLIAELQTLDGPLLMLGSGALLYRQMFASALPNRLVWPFASHLHEIQAGSLAALAYRIATTTTPTASWQVQPIYLRPSEAEMNIGPPEGGPPLRERILADGTILPAPSR